MRSLTLAVLLSLLATVAQAQYAPVTVSWSNMPPAPGACISPVVYVVEESPSISGPYSNVAVILDGSLTAASVPVTSNPAFFIVVMRCPGVGYIASSGVLKWPPPVQPGQ